MVEVRRERDKKTEALLTQLLGIGNYETKVGWFEGAKEENGQQTAYVASVQEYGVPQKNIPPRLGFREVAAKKAKSWRTTLDQLVNQVLKGQMDAFTAMKTLGDRAKGDLARRIASNPPPPLSDRTLAARRAAGRSHTETMVDTGRMQETLESKTEKV